MARLTDKKMHRWADSLTKASHISSKVRYEVGDIANSAQGGRLEAALKLERQLLNLTREFNTTVAELARFIEREARIKAVNL